MGVDTKAIIPASTTLEEIKNVLSSKYKEVKLINTSIEGMYSFNLLANEDERRSLTAFYKDYAQNDYGIKGILLSMSANDTAIELMKLLLSSFGGYLDENDCDDIGFEEYNVEKYNESELTELDAFKNKIVTSFGYDKLNTVLDLCKEYSNM